MSLFVDLVGLSEPRTNEALEYLYKAVGDGHDDVDLWAPHPDPYIRRIVELFSQRGVWLFDALRTELLAWLSGARHIPGGTAPLPPNAPMGRWTTEQISLVRHYLETLPQAMWRLDDYEMAVEFLVQRYLPATDMRTEAEWLATRSMLMGRVKANMADLTEQQAEHVMAALPLTVAGAVELVKPNRAFAFMLDFATNRAAENVRMITEDVRHAMRGVVARYVEERELRLPGVPGQSLETQLRDKFGSLNRDWRRISVTESGECATQGYVASLATGTKVRRIEQYKGVCAFCHKIDGRIMNVVSAEDPNKDEVTDVWPGKTNVGRSASPRKRVGDLLVAREPSEMWTVPAGLVHPNCRGRFVAVMEDRPGDDPEFAAWLRAHLSKKPEPDHVQDSQESAA